MSEETEAVKTLIRKAAAALDAGDAMKFAQAALNAAHAVVSLREAFWGSDTPTAEPERPHP